MYKICIHIIDPIWEFYWESGVSFLSVFSYVSNEGSWLLHFSWEMILCVFSVSFQNVPGLDFERYLRPSEECSPSPGPVAMETLSPMVVDMEMGSPMAEAGSGDLLPQTEALSTPAGNRW